MAKILDIFKGKFDKFKKNHPEDLIKIQRYGQMALANWSGFNEMMQGILMPKLMSVKNLPLVIYNNLRILLKRSDKCQNLW